MNNFYLLLGSLALASALALANIILKLAASNSAEPIYEIYTGNMGKIIIALCLYGGVFAAYPVLLRFFPLNILFPTYTCMTIVLVAAAGVFLFDEKFHAVQLLGLGMLVVGVFLLMLPVK